MEWVHRFLLRFNLYQNFISWTQTLVLPGFDSLPLYTVTVFFFQELRQASLVNKASSLAYSFMLAIFPAMIFLFTLIPYIPIPNFQDTLIKLIAVILPANAYSALQATLEDIIKHQHGKLLSFGFLSALYFATNGVYKLMQAFNKSSLIIERRNWLRKRWVALVLTVMISVSLFGAITILILGQAIVNKLQSAVDSHGKFWPYIIALTRWLIVVVIFFMTVSLLYRYGPAHNRRRWNFLSPGAVLATLLAVLTSLGFSYYINHFSRYNKIYGSIGTLIVVMIWLYLNSLIILVGFELNASIDLSRRNIKPIPPRQNSFKGRPQLED